MMAIIGMFLGVSGVPTGPGHWWGTLAIVARDGRRGSRWFEKEKRLVSECLRLI